VDLAELSSTLTRVFPNMDEEEVQSLFESIEKQEKDKISKSLFYYLILLNLLFFNFIWSGEFNKHMKKYPEYMGVLFSFKKNHSSSANEEKKDL